MIDGIDKCRLILSRRIAPSRRTHIANPALTSRPLHLRRIAAGRGEVDVQVLGLRIREATGRRVPVITTIEGLVGDYVYNEENNRSVAVHSGAIVEVLRKLYDAGALADELRGD